MDNIKIIYFILGLAFLGLSILGLSRALIYGIHDTGWLILFGVILLGIIYMIFGLDVIRINKHSNISSILLIGSLGSSWLLSSVPSNFSINTGMSLIYLVTLLLPISVIYLIISVFVGIKIKHQSEVST